VGTSGLPRCRAQMWFTATRAGSGFFGSVSQRASAVRRPVLVAGYGLARDSSVSRFDSGVFSEPASGAYESPG
jgi:hypothetical protein